MREGNGILCSWAHFNADLVLKHITTKHGADLGSVASGQCWSTPRVRFLAHTGAVEEQELLNVGRVPPLCVVNALADGTTESDGESAADDDDHDLEAVADDDDLVVYPVAISANEAMDVDVPAVESTGLFAHSSETTLVRTTPPPADDGVDNSEEDDDADEFHDADDGATDDAHVDGDDTEADVPPVGDEGSSSEVDVREDDSHDGSAEYSPPGSPPPSSGSDNRGLDATDTPRSALSEFPEGVYTEISFLVDLDDESLASLGYKRLSALDVPYCERCKATVDARRLWSHATGKARAHSGTINPKNPFVHLGRRGRLRKEITDAHCAAAASALGLRSFTPEAHFSRPVTAFEGIEVHEGMACAERGCMYACLGRKPSAMRGHAAHAHRKGKDEDILLKDTLVQTLSGEKKHRRFFEVVGRPAFARTRANPSAVGKAFRNRFPRPALPGDKPMLLSCDIRQESKGARTAGWHNFLRDVNLQDLHAMAALPGKGEEWLHPMLRALDVFLNKVAYDALPKLCVLVMRWLLTCKGCVYIVPMLLPLTNRGCTLQRHRQPPVFASARGDLAAGEPGVASALRVLCDPIRRRTERAVPRGVAGRDRSDGQALGRTAAADSAGRVAGRRDHHMGR